MPLSLLLPRIAEITWLTLASTPNGELIDAMSLEFGKIVPWTWDVRKHVSGTEGLEAFNSFEIKHNEVFGGDERAATSVAPPPPARGDDDDEVRS